MTQFNRSFCAAIVFTCASIAAVASAAPINYGNYLGAGGTDVDFLDVTEDSPTDATPIFEQPLHLPNKLIFSPLGFAAISDNGAPTDTTTGQLTLRVRAAAGESLQYILLRELGQYTLSGVGTPATTVSAAGLLTATDLNPGTSGPFNDPINYAPASTFALPGPSFDQFEGFGVINLAGLSVSEILLTFESTLSASSETSTAAFIQRNLITIEHASVLPEPATISLLLAGTLLFRRRRRSHA